MNDITKKILPPMLRCFSDLKDPRIAGRCSYQVEEIICLTICAIISGARHWTQVEKFGHININWLKRFLLLPNGVPSHYTIGRFWSLVCPEKFMICFQSWLKTCSYHSENKIIAIDGKSSRATMNRGKGLKAAHIVNAFDTCSNLLLNQVKVPDKTNEITAIPTLLKSLEITGCLITTDAMGCQRGIAKLIKNRGADYVLAVKMNQGRLFKKLHNLFQKAESLEYKAMTYKKNETFEYEHGRIEKRTYSILPQCYDHALKSKWPGCQTFIQVKRMRDCGNQKSESIAYFISSLAMKHDKKISKAIRHHWRIENNCHWVLDNTFQEDRCRARRGFASENFSLLRKWVLNLLTKKRRGKSSLEAMRLEAAWDRRFLTRLLN